MAQALQITFRNLDHSDAIENAIREKVSKLVAYYGDIISCHAVIESPHKHQHKGRHYHIKVSLSVPGKDIIVKRAPEQRSAHEDIYVAIRDAFDAAARQLKSYAERVHGQIKQHSLPAVPAV
ncbi:MAG: HPF/RaiA family ribosome-associated protein [Gammaproteobacteria bacterium]|nr:HPF/RaiA family ribosome-associated protein [Gammaproteobacteria bacterium]